jgi:hypothetical protein
MQNAQQHSMKKESHSTNHFNDSEYNRWSQGLKAIQSGNPQWEIESFLKTTDSLQLKPANICVPFDTDWQKLNKGRTTNMAWKLREWKRAVEQLQNRCRSMVEELFSVVGDEETKFGRMELDGPSDCAARSARQEAE